MHLRAPEEGSRDLVGLIIEGKGRIRTSPRQESRFVPELRNIVRGQTALDQNVPLSLAGALLSLGLALAATKLGEVCLGYLGDLLLARCCKLALGRLQARQALACMSSEMKLAECSRLLPTAGYSAMCPTQNLSNALLYPSLQTMKAHCPAACKCLGQKTMLDRAQQCLSKRKTGWKGPGC